VAVGQLNVPLLLLLLLLLHLLLVYQLCSHLSNVLLMCGSLN
jgi:hypothetical protein